MTGALPDFWTIVISINECRGQRTWIDVDLKSFSQIESKSESQVIGWTREKPEKHPQDSKHGNLEHPAFQLVISKTCFLQIWGYGGPQFDPINIFSLTVNHLTSIPRKTLHTSQDSSSYVVPFSRSDNVHPPMPATVSLWTRPMKIKQQTSRWRQRWVCENQPTAKPKLQHLEFWRPTLKYRYEQSWVLYVGAVFGDMDI